LRISVRFHGKVNQEISPFFPGQSGRFPQEGGIREKGQGHRNLQIKNGLDGLEIPAQIVKNQGYPGKRIQRGRGLDRDRGNRGSGRTGWGGGQGRLGWNE
jgi:hypothetical protein